MGRNWYFSYSISTVWKKQNSHLKPRDMTKFEAEASYTFEVRNNSHLSVKIQFTAGFMDFYVADNQRRNFSEIHFYLSNWNPWKLILPCLFYLTIFWIQEA